MDEDAGMLFAYGFILEEIRQAKNDHKLNNDDIAALDAMELNVSLAQQCLHDSLMAQRLERDALLAEDLSQKFDAVWRQEEEDFRLAERLSGRSGTRRTSVLPLSPPPLSKQDQPIAESSKYEVGESSGSSVKGKGVSTLPPTTESASACDVCFSNKTNTLLLPCDHKFCKECTAELFLHASRDDSLLPVKCCSQPLDVNIVDIVLPPRQAQEFRKKVVEYSAVNRMYCTNTRCSVFINLDLLPSSVTGVTSKFQCLMCKTMLCSSCKTEWHENYSCSQYQNLPDDLKNKEDLAMVEIAAQNGWQRCRKCHQFVSLVTGCNHMTCRCGFQFCYLCGLEWKTCQCAQWVEENLIEDANRQVQRRMERLREQLTEEQQADAVQQQVVRLRDDHRCTHRWSKLELGRSGNCDNCMYWLKWYGYNCRTCERIVCSTCRFHRLGRVS